MVTKSTIVTVGLLQLLAAAHLSAHIATANELNVLVYETDEALAASNNIIQANVNGLHPQIVGHGQTFTGFGSKYAAILPALEALAADSLAVISDGRDVLTNTATTDRGSSTTVPRFVEAFDRLTSSSPGSVVISAEAQCCVSALTHFAPGELFGADGRRTNRACYSGKEGCFWNGDDKVQPWESFMRDVASSHGAGSHEDVFLNAGLMVGRASDLIRVIKAADIGEEEDDQAVLTDYMYNHPGQIVLDYGQELFGNNRETCMFELQDSHLVHKQTRTSPLFIHTPGGSSTCHVELMAELGQKAMPKTTKRRLLQWKAQTHNYYEDDECSDGQKLLGGYCVQEWCNADFQCPSGASRRPDRECYDSVHDCTCDDRSQKLLGGYCVQEWCNADFQCPSGASRRPDRECYDSIHDCACDDPSQRLRRSGCH